MSIQQDTNPAATIASSNPVDRCAVACTESGKVTSAAVRRRRFVVGASVAVLVLFAGIALAAITGVWTLNTNVQATSAVLGVTTTVAGNPGSNYANGTMNTAAFWTNPYGDTVNGGPSLQLGITPYGTTRTITVTFSRPVDNPVLHIDRLGGVSGTTSNTSIWTLSNSASLGGAVTLTRLGGNNTQFVVAGNAFQRTANQTVAAIGECDATTTSTACGSIQFNGTGVTSLTFTITWAGPDTGATGDTLEMRWSFAGASVIVRKQSANGTGTFNFAGTNGVGTFALNTATSNPISSATFAVVDHTQPITITETLSPTSAFVLTGANCVDQNNAAVTSSLAGGALTIAAANYRPSQTVTCTFNNNFGTDLSITKTNNATSVTSGTTTTYDIAVSNAGPATAINAAVRDPAPTNLTGCVLGTPACAVNTGTATCPTVGAGAGQLSVANLQSTAGVLIPSMGANSSLTIRLTCTVP